MLKKPQCLVPHSQAFIRPDGQYRDCCSSTPHVIKFEKNFTDWWQGDTMSKLRENVSKDILPKTVNVVVNTNQLLVNRCV